MIQHAQPVIPQRMTARLEKPVVLFLIGMRMNRLRTLPRWFWFLNTMPSMLKELEARPESGLLWYRTYLSFPNIMTQQYWESFDKLMAYSHDKTLTHQPAWARYMRELQNEGSIGIWHETYLIEPGKFECIYGNMPPFGLGAASSIVKAEGRLAAAKERIAA